MPTNYIVVIVFMYAVNISNCFIKEFYIKFKQREVNDKLNHFCR